MLVVAKRTYKFDTHVCVESFNCCVSRNHSLSEGFAGERDSKKLPGDAYENRDNQYRQGTNVSDI